MSTPLPHRKYGLCIALAVLLPACTEIIPPTAHIHFQTSFEMDDPVPLHNFSDHVHVSIGNGPQAPYTAKANVGYTGLHALHYQGEGEGEGEGRRVTLFELDIPVSEHTTLSWKVLPEIVGDDPIQSTLVSTGVSLDILFDDGTRLSELPACDHHGALLGAAAQARSNTLYPQQWVHKQVRSFGAKGHVN